MERVVLTASIRAAGMSVNLSIPKSVLVGDPLLGGDMILDCIGSVGSFPGSQVNHDGNSYTIHRYEFEYNPENGRDNQLYAVLIDSAGAELILTPRMAVESNPPHYVF